MGIQACEVLRDPDELASTARRPTEVLELEDLCVRRSQRTISRREGEPRRTDLMLASRPTMATRAPTVHSSAPSHLPRERARTAVVHAFAQEDVLALRASRVELFGVWERRLILPTLATSPSATSG